MGTFKNIISLKLNIILIICSLALGITIVNKTYLSYERANSKLDTFSSMFNRDNTIFVDVSLKEFNTTTMYDGISYKDLHDVYINTLSKLDNSRYVNKIYIYGQDVPVPKELFMRLPNKYQNLNISNTMNFSQLLTINYNYYKKNPLKVVEGRVFNENDFEQDYKQENIPILLGNEYIGLVDIGEKFHFTTPTGIDDTGNIYNEDITYEVIGILAQDSIPLLTRSSMEGEFNTEAIFENTTSVMPIMDNNFYLGYGGTIGDYGFFLELKDITYLDEVKKTIDDALGKIYPNPLKSIIYELNESFQVNEDYFFRDVETSFAFGILFILLSITGTVTILLGRFQEIKKDFGIKKALGVSNLRLSSEIIKEILCISSLASILSIIYIVAVDKASISKDILIFNILIILVITILISILPIITIIRAEVVYLIRGKE